MIRYFVYLNLYGNLLVLIGFFLGLASAHIFTTNYDHLFGQDKVMPLVIGSLLLLLMGITIASGLFVTSKLNEKYRYYTICMIRIRKHGFSEEILEDAFDSPCYRLLAFEILLEINRLREYRSIKRKMTSPYVTID